MGLRYAAKVDVNQAEIVAGLRKCGFSVLIISQLKNCCDIVAGKDGKNYLIEIKQDNKKKLTEGEQKFFDGWRGSVFIACNLEEVLNNIKLLNNE